MDLWIKGFTLFHLGRDEEARAFMKLVPEVSVSEWTLTEHYKDPNELERYIDYERKACLPP